MDIRTETQTRKRFDKGFDIDVTVVSNGQEIENQTFNKNTYHFEELLDYVNYNENGGNQVYL